MSRSKKIVVTSLLAVAITAISLSGIALAQSDSDPKLGNIIDRVVAVLQANDVKITAEQLQDAFAEVKAEMKTESLDAFSEKQDAFLDMLVEEGKLTQEEADLKKEAFRSKQDGLFMFGGTKLEGSFMCEHGKLGMSGMHRDGHMFKMHGDWDSKPPTD